MGYDIKDCGRKEHVTDDGLEVTREFIVTPWSARGEAYTDLMGGVKLIGGQYVRVVPAEDPDAPNCFVADIQTDPIDAEDYLLDPGNQSPLVVAAQYASGARLVVTYKSRKRTKADVENGDVSEATWEFSTRNITLPSDRYGWQPLVQGTGPDGAPTELLANAGVAATKTIPQVQFAVQRWIVPSLPYTAIVSQMGRVNKNPFAVAGILHPAETLRFDSAAIKQLTTWSGFYFYDITYKFAVQPTYDRYRVYESSGYEGSVTTGGTTYYFKNDYVGWNRVYNPRSGLWERPRLLSDPRRGIYQLDEDGPTQSPGGSAVAGFALLFTTGVV